MNKNETIPPQKQPIVTAQMLIRRPVNDVYTAFVDPTVTSKFWFTHGSGMLEPGAKITWTWAMYGVSAEVDVRAMEANKRIVIAWDDPPTFVEWLFADRGDGTTLVGISHWGFHGDSDEVTAQAIDSKGGFTMVLAGLKAYLEHNVELNLVADHHPDANVDPEE